MDNTMRKIEGQNRTLKKRRVYLITFLVVTFLWGYCFAYVEFKDEFPLKAMMGSTPTLQYKYHDVGYMWLTVTNFGVFGNAGSWKINGENFPSGEFPGGSKKEYLYMGALWIGMVVETSDTTRDTLVSVGADGWRWENEFWPTFADSDTIIERTTRGTMLPNNAVSEQDFLMAYSDDFIDGFSPSQHIPAGIRIEQKNYSWSYAYNRDFVFLLFDIINESDMQFNDLFFGFFVDPDVGPWGPDYSYWKAGDDIVGFRKWKDNSDTLWGSHYYTGDAFHLIGYRKTDDLSECINLVWAADFDGDKEPDPQLPDNPLYGFPIAADGASGMRVLSPQNTEISFNWWISHWKPEFDWGPTKPSGTDIVGTPIGDRSKYILMTNHYIDPDMVGERGVNASPYHYYPSNVDSVNDPRYLLSGGPFTVGANDTLSIVIVYTGGERFVTQYGQYDFSDIVLNASWAYRIFDNPGVDTPDPVSGIGDGYRGEFVIHDTSGPPFDDGDTVWISGDGIPDFIGPPPPPIPEVTLINDNQKVTLLWTKKSEKYKNMFVSSLPEVPAGLDTNYFEGYRIYRSKSGVFGEWSLIREYDRMDFIDSTGTEPIGWNIGMPPDTVIGSDTFYKFVDNNVTNYTSYFYSVTAFDKGWPINDGSILPILESSLEGNSINVFPSANTKGDEEVIVIPNPYRSSETEKYISLGWEEPSDFGIIVHRKRIVFANLPPQSTLRIYSLSGDHLKTIEHNYSESNKSYEDWNLITRDIQEIVPGIYLFSVENNASGNVQVGKFVIIK
jgi:hypothetical protein